MTTALWVFAALVTGVIVYAVGQQAGYRQGVRSIMEIAGALAAQDEHCEVCEQFEEGEEEPMDERFRRSDGETYH